MPEDSLQKLGFVLFGALLGWILQQYRVMRAEDTALVNEHIKEIERLRDLAQDYWLKKVESQEEAEAAAARVRAAHAATTFSYMTISEICHPFADDYQRLSVALFECATGGNFESARSEIEPLRAIELYDISTQLIHVLRSSRRSLNSLKGILPRSIRDFGA